jgi:hypothetical protein
VNCQMFCKIILAIVLVSNIVHAQGRPALTHEQQKSFLSERTASGTLIGQFSSFGSMLYAVHDVTIHSDDKEVNDTRLEWSFPAYYKPTWSELFDFIARQTGTSWKYDSIRDYWVFSKPAMKLPYEIDIANHWTSHDEGLYVGYTPPTAPVGMDIYALGLYSPELAQAPKMLEKVRNSWAMQFAEHFKRNVTINQMEKVIVDGAESLYFEAPAPREGFLWRQWVFIKDGQAFAIVSTLKRDDTKLLTDVRSMVNSFHLK